MKNNLPQPIAIVGIGGIFPGASSLTHFWENILNNRSAAKKAPSHRWTINPEEAVSSHIAFDKTYSPISCLVDDFSLYSQMPGIDRQFLDILDPLFHFVLYAGTQAFNDGITKNLNRDRTGVIIGNIALPTEKSSALAEDYIGTTIEEMVLGQKKSLPKIQTDPINRYVCGLPAGLLAKTLGLGGGTYTVDAACASSLYALSLSIDKLLSRRCDAMITGGVSRPDCFYTQMGFSQLHALSKSGISAPFCRNGDGLVVGEGSGMFLLKRLDDALRDEDHIYACIKGIGLSNDIGGSLLAPNSEGQIRSMTQAYKSASLEPDDVDLIECHATGTPLGDRVEFESLMTLWEDTKWTKGQCTIGSVKSNIGHLLTAAGASGLMKVLLALKNNTLPPTANFTSPASKINLSSSPFTILNKPAKWIRREPHIPRRGAVSAFGFGGINAHVLLEEWLPDSIKSKTKSLNKPGVKVSSIDNSPIAIVGMDAHFGPLSGLDLFSKKVLSGDKKQKPAFMNKWFGCDKSDWFLKRGMNRYPYLGYTIDNITVPLRKFRIPPLELKEMLPQQLLMLLVAKGAIDDAGINRHDHKNTGVFIGLGLDLNTTNFHIRWMISKKVKEWILQLGLTLTEAQEEQWVKDIRDKIFPPLSPGRTIGSLGSIVASRISREFKFGGPSFALSSEESSGLTAIACACARLNRGEISNAVVGAVDFASDIRSVLTLDPHPDGAVTGEGAGAIILKPLDAAIRDKDKIYSVIKGVGTASGGDVKRLSTSKKAYKQALMRAYQNGQVDPASVGLIETAIGGNMPEDLDEADLLSDFFASRKTCKQESFHKKRGLACVGGLKTDIGNTGAASGLASLIRASLCLYHEMLPSLQNKTDSAAKYFAEDSNLFSLQSPQYWFQNRFDGPRRAGVSSTSGDGNCIHVVMEAYKRERKKNDPIILNPLSSLTDTIFVLKGDIKAPDNTIISTLRNFIENNRFVPLHLLQKRWHRLDRLKDNKNNICAIVTNNHDQLLEKLKLLENRLSAHTDQLSKDDLEKEDIFISKSPLGPTGSIAFLYPGSGNHFAGMGQNLPIAWPGLIRRQGDENQYLKNQYNPLALTNCSRTDTEDPRYTMMAQVSVGTVVTDCLLHFGISPKAAIGYSLGESTALFSLGVWKDKDAMLKRLFSSSLFTEELAGTYKAAQRAWGLKENEPVNWVIGIVNQPAEVIQKNLYSAKKVYLLLINTPTECVIGGEKKEVDKLVTSIGSTFFQIPGATIAHCEILRGVAYRYRNFHLFPTYRRDDITFYSGASAGPYKLTPDEVADSILAHGLRCINFPSVIERAYRDGVRLFIEVGPGRSLSRMVGQILHNRPHLAQSCLHSGKNEVTTIIRLAARLIAEGVPLTLDLLEQENLQENLNTKPDKNIKRDESITISLAKKPFRIPGPPQSGNENIETVAPPAPREPNSNRAVIKPAAPFAKQTDRQNNNQSDYFQFLIKKVQSAATKTAQAHESYLDFSHKTAEIINENIGFLRGSTCNCTIYDEDRVKSPVKENSTTTTSNTPLFTIEECFEFARGKVKNVLGEEYAEIDSYPTRVRLPDDPLMLVHRILTVEGEKMSLKSGRVVTEHDIVPNAWYLDAGYIPTSIAVESGQADLFLSGYLGIDKKTRGLAVYRLLDAVVTFHRDMPGPGETIVYDIHIENFFKQADTYLFRFSFEAAIQGEPYLTMQQGCAGFFTELELSLGKGISKKRIEIQKEHAYIPKIVEPFVPMKIESYSKNQIDCLRQGNLTGCFGEPFLNLRLTHPIKIPDGKMNLVDRVTRLSPVAGKYNSGMIRAEADIHPDDWFLTCHFVDDRVMPGTLMYECCLHTLRIYLMRMGWVGPEDVVSYHPIPKIASRLKCRGQVTQKTKTVVYEISIKETGFMPEPYVIVDALMYADNKMIVEITDMSLRFKGLTKEFLLSLWSNKTQSSCVSQENREKIKKPLYDNASILAFAIGKPSEAFGKAYTLFDSKRTIARLPGPPYKFLDRITYIDAIPWKMQQGGVIEAEYDVPFDAWYFEKNRTKSMPFSILLEVALQPCGWFAAYMGSALLSEKDLHFRNLGGSALCLIPVTQKSGTLTTKILVTKVSMSGNMIIQHFDFEVRDKNQVVYKGNTYFGFFTKEALSRQIGIRNAKRYIPRADEVEKGAQFSYPKESPYPMDMLQMVDRITLYNPTGGREKKGFIRGEADVLKTEWFFTAHFYQDPVCPGSLGLESFLQLLKIAANKRWGDRLKNRLETIILHEKHHWVYRGQIIPTDKKITIEAVITDIDDNKYTINANGYLIVDTRVIYHLQDFGLMYCL